MPSVILIAVALIQKFTGFEKPCDLLIICSEILKRRKVILLLVDIVLSALEPPTIIGNFPHLSLVMKFLFKKIPKHAQESLSLDLRILEKKGSVHWSSIFFPFCLKKKRGVIHLTRKLGAKEPFCESLFIVGLFIFTVSYSHIFSFLNHFYQSINFANNAHIPAPKVNRAF